MSVYNPVQLLFRSTAAAMRDHSPSTAYLPTRNLPLSGFGYASAVYASSLFLPVILHATDHISLFRGTDCFLLRYNLLKRGGSVNHIFLLEQINQAASSASRLWTNSNIRIAASLRRGPGREISLESAFNTFAPTTACKSCQPARPIISSTGVGPSP